MMSLTSLIYSAGGLTGKKIAIDPGHGPSSVGAVGPTGLTEHYVAYDVGSRLGSYIKNTGGGSYMLTRTATSDPSLYTRQTSANNWGAGDFISIHMNASSNQSTNGTLTMWRYTDNSWKGSENLAKKVHSRLIAGLGLRNIGAYPTSRTDLSPAGHNTVKYTASWMNAILAEVSFISNPYEESRLKTASYRDKIAAYMYWGICDFHGVSAW